MSNSATARSIAELVSAQLSADPDIVLVERENVGTLFREIETALLAGGLGGLASRMQLVGTDLFAVCSAPEAESEVALVVFDAETGLRFVDTVLGASQLDEQVRLAVGSILEAATKRRQLSTDQLHAISVVALRGNLPPADHPVLRGVGYLLEQMIVNAPDMLLLERRSLEWVNRERLSISPEAGGALAGGHLLLEIELGRTVDGMGLEGVVQVLNSQGDRVARLEASTTDRNPQALAGELFRQLAATLGSGPVSFVPDSQREADRLFAEFLFLAGHNQSQAALERMEASAALDPSRTIPHLGLALLRAGRPLVRGNEEQFERGLEYGEREMALRQEAQRQNPSLRLYTREHSRENMFDFGFYYLYMFDSDRASGFNRELQQRRLALLRAHVIFIADRDGVSSSPWHTNRLASLLWLENRPDSIADWLRTEGVRWKENARYSHVRKHAVLDCLVPFLREVSRNGVRPGEPPVREVAQELLALYDQLDLESSVTQIPPDLKSDLVWHVPEPADRDPVLQDRVAPGAMPDEPAAHRAVRVALDWLAENQLTDGSWKSEGPRPDLGKTAATGLALLAYLASGEGVPGERYWPTVERGLRFLVERDLLRGGGFSDFSPYGEPSHGMATQALCEAYALTGIPVLRQAASLAANRIQNGQLDTGVIYSNAIDNEVSGTPHVSLAHTVWMLQPLAAALNAGLDVSGMDEMLDKAAQAILNAEAYDHTKGSFSLHTTAAATHSLLWLGYGDTPAVRTGLEVLKAAAADETRRAEINRSTYNRYFTTQLMLQIGGDAWDCWSRSLHADLVPTQRADGSWGSLLVTLQNILSLTAHQRNLLVSRPAPFRTASPMPDHEGIHPHAPWLSMVQLTDSVPRIVIQDGTYIYAVHGIRQEIHRIALSDFSRYVLPLSIETSLRVRELTGYDSENRAVITPDHLILGSNFGVLMVPLRGGVVRRLSTEDGLPSSHVQSMAWLDGQLYMALGARDRGAWLVRYDPQRGETEILLASGRIGSNIPLEQAIHPPHIPKIIPDPERERLLILVDASDSRRRATDSMYLSGLWEYRLTDRTWELKVPTTRRQSSRYLDYMSTASCKGNRLLIGHGHGRYALQFDMETDESQVLWAPESWRHDIRWLGDTSSPLIGHGKSGPYYPPYWITDDWLWMSSPFARGNIETGEMELLPRVGGGVLAVIGATPEERHLLVVTREGLWALELKPGEEKE